MLGARAKKREGSFQRQLCTFSHTGKMMVNIDTGEENGAPPEESGGYLPPEPQEGRIEYKVCAL